MTGSGAALEDEAAAARDQQQQAGAQTQGPQQPSGSVQAAVGAADKAVAEEEREEGEEVEERPPTPMPRAEPSVEPSTEPATAVEGVPKPQAEEPKERTESKPAAAEGTSESRSRRARSSVVYERYLNVKQNALKKAGGMEVSNSTDEQEREAGELFAAARQRAFMEQMQRQAPTQSAGAANGSPRANGNSSRNGNGGPRLFNEGHEVFSPHGPPRGRSRSRSPPRNGAPPPPFEQGGPRFQGGRGGSPPRRYSNGDGPPPRGRSRSRSPPRPFDRRGPMSPRGGGGRGFSPPRNFGGRGPMSPRGGGRAFSPPRDFGGRGPMGRSPPRDFGGRGPMGRSPPRDFGGRGPPRDFGGRGPMGRSPPRDFGGRGPMGRSPPRDFRGRGPMGRSPPRDFGGRGPMGRSPPRDFGGRGPMGRSPPRDFGGRGPMGRFRSRSRSPPRGLPPSRDGWRSGSADGFGQPRGFDQRGPPPAGYDPRGPPAPYDMRGPPSRGRSRSRSPPRPRSAGEMSNGKRDRSWDRGGPPMGMVPKRAAYEPPMMMEHPVGDWTFDLKRSGKPRCRCRAVAQGVPVREQLPLAMDVVELPHLNKFADFLYIGRPNIRRVVYELHPDSIGDRRGYDEFCNYLIEGRNAVARAGVAREMEKHGYKIFILPPGQAARALGYKGTQMIACVRSR